MATMESHTEAIPGFCPESQRSGNTFFTIKKKKKKKKKCYYNSN